MILPQPIAHRAHDYAQLIRRWRAICKPANLRMTALHQAGDTTIHCVTTRAVFDNPARIYISAGIHGDEPAATEALITWVERRTGNLPPVELMLFPCLNPWGLINNSRVDALGRDLNRLFHRPAIPLIKAWRSAIAGRRFDLALTLHEDFDAQGVYVYEVGHKRPHWGRELLLAAAAGAMPVDPRRKIDISRPVAPGLIRRRVREGMFRDTGYPEAISLHLEYSDRTFTIETPSEFNLNERVEAQIRALDAAVELTLNR
jgi:hypothetical protein